MASVSNSAATSSSSYIKNMGIGGLASGLDTDSLVDALISGTKSKIAKQGQTKQLLNWKMTAYRGLATAMKAFQDKAFSLTANSSTNIRSAGFFNTYKATSSSTKVSVSTTTNSTATSFTIDKINQLAKSETISSGAKLSSDLMLNITDGKQVGENAFTGETIKISYSTSSNVKTIKLDSLNNAIKADGTLDLSKAQEELQTLLDNAFSTKNIYNSDTGKYDKKVSNVTATIVDGKIKLDSDSAKLIVQGKQTLLGAADGATNRVDTSTQLGNIAAFKDSLQGDVFKFTINDVEITASKTDTISSLLNKIKSSDAGVNATYSTINDTFTLTAKTSGGGDNIVLRDTQGNLMNQLFGAKSGNGVGSNYISLSGSPTSQDINKFDSMSVEDKKALASKLSNMTFDMTINGVTKTVKLDTAAIPSDLLSKGTYTANDIYAAMNKGISTAFDTGAVTFASDSNGKTIINSAQGMSVSVEAKGIARDYLGFTERTGNNAFDLGYSNSIASSGGMEMIPDSKGNFTMTINGITKTLEVGNVAYQNAESKLNAAIEAAFGKDIASKVKFSAEFEYSDAENTTVSGANLKLNITDQNIAVSMGAGETSAAKGTKDIFASLGFGTGTVQNYSAGSTGSATLGSFKEGATLSDGTLTIKIGEGSSEKTVTVDYSKTTNMSEFLQELNTKLGADGSAGIKDGQLYIKGNDDTFSISDSGSILADFFGVKGGSYTSAAENYGDRHVKGQNAEIVVDGRVLSERTNTFNIGGSNVTVNEISTEAIEINVESDPDDVVDRIKSWIEDYNALVYTLNKAVGEGKNRDYEPLTDEQKADMTAEQIKTWETEAKKGLLRNDQTVNSILSQMREALYKKVESAGISLFDLGITTKNGLAAGEFEAGQLEFDQHTNGEERLRALLQSDPDKVRRFFTDENDGLATRLNNIIDGAARTSSVNRGTLINLAGTEISTGNNTSVLGDKIDAIDKYVALLKTRMESEYNRYWKQFSALEVAIQRMSAQSSWLNQ